MLLPTGYYAVGGALAVALSFLMLVLIPPGMLDRAVRARLVLGAPLRDVRCATSLASFVLLVVLVAAGLAGSRDPLSNPLPLVFWTLVWVGLVLVQGLVGDVWRWIDPWYGPWRLALRILGRSGDGRLFVLPASAACWPAVLAFLGFAWLELIYPSPDDPAVLATIIGLYWSATLLLMIAFGHAAWSAHVEFLSLFMRMISRLGVLARERGGDTDVLSASLPAARLPSQPPLQPSGVVFLLLALASVSFDGLMRTFFWLGLNGVNPLEFPGRSEMIATNAIGLLGMFLVLALAFLGAVAAGERLAGGAGRFEDAAGALVWSLVPIALAYHFSHYLVSLLVNGQYALVALSDPFSLGWDLFGTAYLHVTAGIVAGADSAWMIWNVQAAAIIFGHVLGVGAAHVIAWRRYGDARAAAVSQIPLAILMVAYTVFGLWLLSTPTAG